jgi:hypothetical protein
MPGRESTPYSADIVQLLHRMLVLCRAGPPMRSLDLMLLAFLLVLVPPAAAESARQIKKQDDALVRSLEALYAKSMQVARRGDLDAYWRWRTNSSRDRPPRLTRPLLPLFAGMLPALGTLQFVRMDTNSQTARALYKWPREDMARYTVVVYRIEDGEWKIDSITVRTDAVSNPQEHALAQKLRQLNPDYHPER